MTRGYLAVGHGRTPAGAQDPGAVDLGNPGPDDDVREYDLAFVVTSAAHAALSRSGVEHFTETAGGAGHDPDYRGSAAAVNAGRYDWALEIHFDSANTPEGGFGIYAAAGSPALPLAAAIDAAWRARRLLVKPSYPDRRGLYFLKATRCPALIFECGPTHARPADVLDTMGEAVAAGVCAWLGVPYASPGVASLPLPPPANTGSMPLVDSVIAGADVEGGGTWLAGSDGAVYALGGGPFWGSMGGHPLNGPVVDLVPHGRGGYWLVGSDGGIFAFGDAPPVAEADWRARLRAEVAAGARRIVGGYRTAGAVGLALVSNHGELYRP